MIGNFAPPLDAGKLASYTNMADEMSGPQSVAFATLLAAVSEFLAKDVPPREGSLHPSGVGKVEKLTDGEKVELPEDLDEIGRTFDSLEGERRDAAYHLLWYARELKLGRRPITTDTL